MEHLLLAVALWFGGSVLLGLAVGWWMRAQER